MKKTLTAFGKNFLRCGVVGWCMEILYTACNSIRRRDRKLTGSTSLWMFPIYGSAALLAPISRLLKKKSFWKRGLTYMSLIFSGEYLSGSLLRKHSLCPWDYYKSRFHIGRVIRLDYAPLWFCTGLLFERLFDLSAKPKTAEP